MKDIKRLKQNKVSLKEIESYFDVKNYIDLCNLVNELIDKEDIKPIKASKMNGKSPALYNRYTIVRKNDVKDYTEEILYTVNHNLDISKYLKNQALYEKDRDNILMLSEFLNNNMEQLNTRVSMNERSFQIWHREKFLQKEGGKTLIKNLGIDQDFLNFYNTTEPLSYYSRDKKTPQNVLIIENKDTFYSMRNLVIDGKTIIGEDISTIIYGGGKSIYKSFEDFDLCVESYLSNRENKLLYFGDLDYEGILIYEKLSDIFKDEYQIEPFVEGYKKMIQKYKNLGINLPVSSENQNKNIDSKFMSYFDEYYKNEIEDILKSGLYIPQEILNVGDF